MAWKYIDTKDETGEPLEDREGEAQARSHFEIRDPKCPVLETEVPGKYAVWCAAALPDASDYPQLHHAPAEPEAKAKFKYVKAG